LIEYFVNIILYMHTKKYIILILFIYASSFNKKINRPNFII
jgi:hypothetical protein